ncbi:MULTISPECIES: ketosteroid isomerase family protein [unclassified Mycobacterium]|uniref:nuclear transport factor 2 family protein n=1 Tax=unclassified Mycobacterium TaxID=2642494 RepID=UPI00048D24E1|nr:MULTISPECIES: ketosteroid isomerase family protein [unclassified Mycobacterium]SEA56939.1 SnoaL-like domain-containing protein [Mycobacterium sp. 283mftsu]
MSVPQSPTRDDLLATVERSPAATAAHDKAAWVGLFSADGRVEDPVGSRPHVGRRAIAQFYDTFIGPRTIMFHRDADIVLGNTVVRDLELEVHMGSKVQLRIPVYLQYDVVTEGSDPSLKISRLQAFWELPGMVAQFVRCGAAALPAGLGLSGALLRNQGPGGALGFLAGLRTGGTRAKRSLTGLLADAANGDELAVKRRLSEPVQITRGLDTRLSVSELVEELTGSRVAKVIAAGRYVLAGVRRDGYRGVVIAELGLGGRGIIGLRLFAE